MLVELSTKDSSMEAFQFGRATAAGASILNPKQCFCKTVFWTQKLPCQFAFTHQEFALIMGGENVRTHHTTLTKWLCKHTPGLQKCSAQYLRPASGPWKADRTHIKTTDQWHHPYMVLL